MINFMNIMHQPVDLQIHDFVQAFLIANLDKQLWDCHH